MIRIEDVYIEEFRGIRKLALSLSGENFCIYGPNGSGKSGVVDAIEFALTGDISRLSGEGTGGISVAKHGPHVDKRDFPDAAFVRLKLTIPSLGKSATIERKVRKPNEVLIEPDEPAVREILDEVARHPEITLSRREIIKFILAKATKRSQDVQTLLKLDEIDETRGALKTAYNRLSRKHETAEGLVRSSSDELRRLLDVPQLTTEATLGGVNKRRAVLGLAEIPKLDKDTSLSEGVSDGGDHGKAPLHKGSALRDVESLRDAVAAGLDARSKAQAESTIENLSKLEADPDLLAALKKRAFIESGLSLVEGPQCPLCDAEWDTDELKSHLEEKLERSKLAEAIQTGLLNAGSSIGSDVDVATALIRAVVAIALKLDPEFAKTLSDWNEELEALRAKLETIDGLLSVKRSLEYGWPEVPAGLVAGLDDLRDKISALPDESDTAEARKFLIIAQERFEKDQKARRETARTKEASRTGSVVYSEYCNASEEVLSKLYAEVEEEFGRFYRIMNEDDEGEFAAKLAPADGKLDLEVDFYQRGMFPPSAYHSEGHQDGMGVCLYLALMKRVLEENFELAVLDDVVMSIDHQHRRQFCKLLKDEFPNTQFIITTHEQLWATQMRKAGLVPAKAAVAFRGWTIDIGPLVHEIEEVWTEITQDLEKGKVSAASATLRRHLEFVLREAADDLVAPIPFRGDDSWDLGDLYPNVLSRYKKLLGVAAKAAQSWGNEDAKGRVKALQGVLSEIAEKCGGENWMINKAIHYNEWAGFTAEEFEPVVEAFTAFLVELRCANCNAGLRVTPKRGPLELLGCDCGERNLALKEKEKVCMLNPRTCS